MASINHKKLTISPHVHLPENIAAAAFKAVAHLTFSLAESDGQSFPYLQKIHRLFGQNRSYAILIDSIVFEQCSSYYVSADLMMLDASKAAFGGEAILPIFSSQKIPIVAPVMTSPSFIASSRFLFTSNGGVVILFYYNIFNLILEIFSGPLSGCDFSTQ